MFGYLLVKDVVATEFLHKCGVFEDGKCITRVVQIDIATLNTKQLLEYYRSKAPEPRFYEVIGVAIPNGTAHFINGNSIFSDGNGFITANEYCQANGIASPQFVRAA